MSDPTLGQLLAERERLHRELAPILTRVGGNHPKRQTVNAKRATVRKQLRHQLRRNGDAIVAIIYQRYITNPTEQI